MDGLLNAQVNLLRQSLLDTISLDTFAFLGSNIVTCMCEGSEYPYFSFINKY